MHGGGFISFDSLGKTEEQAPEAAGTPVRIAAGEQLEHEILLDDLAVLTVRVLRNGVPAPDVSVRLTAKQEGSDYYSGWNSSGVSGVSSANRR